jgi:hypothetical protein
MVREDVAAVERSVRSSLAEEGMFWEVTTHDGVEVMEVEV